MPPLIHVVTASPQIDPDASHVTDLALGADDILYATMRGDGDVQAWGIGGGTLTHLQSVSYGGDAMAGGDPHILVLDDQLLSGGHMINLAQSGALAAPTPINSMPNLRIDGDMARLDHTVFAAIGGKAGIASLYIAASGAVTGHTTTPTDAPVSALTTVAFASASYVVSAGSDAAALDIWTMGANETLRSLDQIDADDGLWVSSPTALETVQYENQTYLILAAAGSSSLTVMTMDQGGGLTITDHVIDDRHSRFDGVTEIATVTHDGHVFLIAAGRDDGISLFQLMPSGTLLARAHLADTPDMALANLSAMTAQSRNGGIDIFTASSSETGLTRLRIDLGLMNPAQYATQHGGLNRGNDDHDLLVGGAGIDRLMGQAGDDIIIDGGARDMMTGGDGADIFALSADGSEDVITDFAFGIDRLDLTAWHGLRSLDQLDISDVHSGIRIIYGDEILFLDAQAGHDITADMLLPTDITFSTRIDAAITAGHAAAATQTPDLPNYTPPAADKPDPKIRPTGLDLTGSNGADRIIGENRDDVLRGADGADVIYGLNGDDVLHGGAGTDRIYGNNGNDILTGGDGRNMGWARDHDPAADALYGGYGHDVIKGGSGADLIDGDRGNDTLTGGGGRDTFVFSRGHDVITDYTTYVDDLLLEGKLTNRNTNTAEVVDTYAHIEDGDLVFDFGWRGTLTLDGIDSTDGIADAISFY